MSEDAAVIDLLHRQHSENMRAHDRTSLRIDDLIQRVGNLQTAVAALRKDLAIQDDISAALREHKP